MRITRNKIRRLIRESILKEQNASTNPIGTFTPRKIQNQSKQQPPPSTGDSLAAAATAAANQSQPTTQGTSVAQAKKKGPSKIVQLQKIIGTKADGSWGPKSDAAWKAWLEADQHRNFMAIMKLGLDKRPNIPKEAFSMALETNSASYLAYWQLRILIKTSLLMMNLWHRLMLLLVVLTKSQTRKAKSNFSKVLRPVLKRQGQGQRNAKTNERLKITTKTLKPIIN